MKTIYLECNMGAAGDMLMGALFELLPDRESKDGFLKKMNELGLFKVKITEEKAVKCGITGTHIDVKIDGEEEQSLDVHGHEKAVPEEHVHQEHLHQEHTHQSHIHQEYIHQEHTHQSHVHMGMKEIGAVIDGFPIEDTVKQHVKEIYKAIAQAESQVHGRPVSEVHFHEVGAADAIADITGCALLFHMLGAEQVIVSPVSTGFGQVRCAHGILPVPAPATALLLTGIPCRAGNIEGELCTPTGAAVLKHYASSYGRMPEMVIEKIGYGMGKKDFPAANCIRAIAGTSRFCI